MGKRTVLGWVIGALACFAPVAAAQSLDVLQRPLLAGGVATIVYTDPEKAGEAIAIVIKNADFGTPLEHVIYINLDEQGRGTRDWPVPHSPDWDVALFHGPGVTPVGRMIVPGPAPGGGGGL